MSAINTPDVSPETAEFIVNYAQEVEEVADLPGLDDVAAIDVAAYRDTWSEPDEAWVESLPSSPGTDRLAAGADGHTAVLDTEASQEFVNLSLSTDSEGVVATARLDRRAADGLWLTVFGPSGNLVHEREVQEQAAPQCGVESTIGCATVSATRLILIALVCGGGAVDPLPIEEGICLALGPAGALSTVSCWANRIICFTQIPVAVGEWRSASITCTSTDACRFDGTYALDASAPTPSGDVWWTGHMTPDAMQAHAVATTHAETPMYFPSSELGADGMRIYRASSLWWHSDVRCAFTVDAVYRANFAGGTAFANKPAGTAYCF